MLSLAVGARDVPVAHPSGAPRLALRSLGRPFLVYSRSLASSTSAIPRMPSWRCVRRRGVSVVGILAMLVVFNGVYALVSTPAGSLSDGGA